MICNSKRLIFGADFLKMNFFHMDMTCALTIHNKQRVRDMSLPDRHVKIHVGLGTRILLNIASKLMVAITEPEESSKKRPNPDS